MDNLKYIQLDFGAFLGDADFQMMSDRQRGVYISLILYLYSNKGVLPNTPRTLFNLCNSTEETFNEDWEFIKKKFVITETEISHNRVDREIEKAIAYYTKKRMAGELSGIARREKAKKKDEHRLNSDRTQDELSKSKVKKKKENKGKDFKKPLDFTVERPYNFKKLFFDEFEPDTQYEKNTLSKLAKDYGEKYKGLKHTGRYIFDKIRDLKEMGKIQKKTRLDMIKIFVSQIKKELK